MHYGLFVLLRRALQEVMSFLRARRSPERVLLLVIRENEGWDFLLDAVL